MKSSQSSLHEFLDTEERIGDRFKVEDESSANWALRKIGQMEDQIEQNSALAVAEIDKINQWSHSENEKSQQSIDYFQSLLVEYALQKKKEDPEFKSLKLPNGRLGFSTQQPKWDYDNKKVVESLKKSGLTNLVRVTEAPDKASVKKILKVMGGRAIHPETGEIVEGITVEEREDSFNVVVDK